MAQIAPRIVSLLPSATEISVALGLGDHLVGRSHECDYPPQVARLPVCTATKLEKGLTSRQIDDRVKEIVRQGLSAYEVHAELLKALKPDLILTQTQCAICAVTPADLKDSLDLWFGAPPALLSLAPDRLSDVWRDIAAVAREAGVADRGEALIADIAVKLGGLRSRTLSRTTPSVAAIEWCSPLMVAGNWIPALIETAGGRPLFLQDGEHSACLPWAEFISADPDYIVLMPCGYTIEQSLTDLAALSGRGDWCGLRAVQAGRVFVADGHHFFNRPGPRLVRSAEIIAEILNALADVNEGDGWRRYAAPEHA